MKKEILILSSVGIVALIIGGSILLSQSAKQSSIERQQRAELQVKQDALDYQKEQDRKAEEDEYWNKQLLDACINDADVAYWSYMELNGTPQADGSIYALTRHWDTAKRDKQDYIDNCYKKYK
jgi:hypothetical protein